MNAPKLPLKTQECLRGILKGSRHIFFLVEAKAIAHYSIWSVLHELTLLSLITVQDVGNISLQMSPMTKEDIKEGK